MGRMIHLPAPCSVVPSFTLADLQGRRVSLWDYKHRQPVLLICCEGGDDAALLDVARHWEEYVDAGVAVLAVSPTPPKGKAPPFPLLIDQNRAVLRRLTQNTPAILLLDSYNALQPRLEGPWPNGPDHRRMLQWIWILQLQCPECGVPEWPQP